MERMIKTKTCLKSPKIEIPGKHNCQKKKKANTKFSRMNKTLLQVFPILKYQKILGILYNNKFEYLKAN